MKITLQIVDGPGLGRKIILKTGQRATIGRTEEADYCFSDNEKMSGLHLALVCDPTGCRVRDLNSSNGTALNGHLITHAELKQGDELTAGQAVFRVILDGAAGSDAEDSLAPGAAATLTSEPLASSPDSATTSPDAAPVRDQPRGFIAAMVPEICGNIEELEDAARALVDEEQSPQQYLAILEQNELFTDAIHFMARALAKRDAVDWATECVRSASRDDLSEADARALEVAQAWVSEPNEENRRAAMAAAEALEFETPASWAAIGAFWSEGSMGPPDVPDIPPASHLTAHAVASSAILAAVMKKPENAPEKYRNFIQLGIKKGEPPAAP